MAVWGDLGKACRLPIYSRQEDAEKAAKATLVEPARGSLAPRPVFRAGVTVVAKEKLKWKKGGVPMPASKMGSAFKVRPGAVGVVAGLNPLRVDWGEGRVGAVRGDQIRRLCAGEGDTGGSGPRTITSSSLEGKSQTMSSVPSTASGDLSTTTGGSRASDLDSVSSGPSSSAAGPSQEMRRALVKMQYWDRQVPVRVKEPVLCTGGLRRLILCKIPKLCRP
mmetsp:Transcript_61561/g.179919  ORF Transcript_61561/g.179919 Transcript_61561/m.179919 type:complete len:221 (-) Transcript_61561:135-797(-)